MIFSNVFLALITDAFGEMREKAWINENDKNNVCFICQIDRNKCLINKIDFEEHLKSHNLFNYMFFSWTFNC